MLYFKLILSLYLAALFILRKEPTSDLKCCVCDSGIQDNKSCGVEDYKACERSFCDYEKEQYEASLEFHNSINEIKLKETYDKRLRMFLQENNLTLKTLEELKGMEVDRSVFSKFIDSNDPNITDYKFKDFCHKLTNVGVDGNKSSKNRLPGMCGKRNEDENGKHVRTSLSANRVFRACNCRQKGVNCKPCKSGGFASWGLPILGGFFFFFVTYRTLILWLP